MGDVALESRQREARAARQDRRVIGSLRQAHGLLLRPVRRTSWPRVAVTTRRTIRKDKYVDYVGEYHLELLVKLGLLPVMLPVVEGTLAALEQYARGMAGLLIVEGEDIEPKRFRARRPNHRYLEKTHPLKDRLELALLRKALSRRIPILGICRGCQILNVAAGGSLYGDVQKEKRSTRPHINYDHYDTYRHPVSVIPGTPLETWYRQKTFPVNSYHHQGIYELAPRFKPMAHADDGLIEAFYDPKTPFTVGLQFHPERMLSESPGNLRVWKAFARAVHHASRPRCGHLVRLLTRASRGRPSAPEKHRSNVEQGGPRKNVGLLVPNF